MENSLYDSWNEVKKSTNEIKRNLKLVPREIYWAKIGLNIGDEQYGKGKEFVRPLIIIRVLTRDLFLGVPTTTSQKENNEYFHNISYKDDLKRDINSSAIIFQQRVFSKKRLLSKIGVVSKDDFSEIKNKLKNLIDPT